MRAPAAAAFLGVLLVPGTGHAQGFGIYEQGACVMSRGGAGVADPCEDGSAIYVNPAGLAGRRGIVVSGGATLIFPSGTFESDRGIATALDSSPAAPPHGYFQYGFDERFALGVGVYVPYGLGVKWPLDFGGRFVGYDSRLQTAYVQPTVAYAPTDTVAVGGGLTFGMGSVDLNRREDLAAIPLGIGGLTFGALVDSQTDFVDTALSASRATGIGANVGVIVEPHDRIRLGARYLTRVKLTYDGTATFTPLTGGYRVTRPNSLGLPVGTPLDTFVSQARAALANQAVSTALEMPAQFTAGLSVQVSRRVKLFTDYQWIDWSAFDVVTLDFAGAVPPDERLVQGYADTGAVRVGIEFEASPGLRLSAGYFFNEAAAPAENVTPLLPDARRNHVTAGMGWDLNARLTLHAAYQFVHHADRRGRIVNPAPGERPTIALNSGVYSSRGDLLGITLTYRR